MPKCSGDVSNIRSKEIEIIFIGIYYVFGVFENIKRKTEVYF